MKSFAIFTAILRVAMAAPLEMNDDTAAMEKRQATANAEPIQFDGSAGIINGIGKRQATANADPIQFDGSAGIIDGIGKRQAAPGLTVDELLSSLSALLSASPTPFETDLVTFSTTIAGTPTELTAVTTQPCGGDASEDGFVLFKRQAAPTTDLAAILGSIDSLLATTTAEILGCPTEVATFSTTVAGIPTEVTSYETPTITQAVPIVPTSAPVPAAAAPAGPGA
ncbi:hypothetical protein ACLX1H_004535 [Fusarium chlamydosporum]